MDERKENLWDFNLQLFADGGDEGNGGTQDPEKKKEDPKEGAEQKNEDPIAKLRQRLIEEATKLGVDPTELKMMTTKELQSQIDKEKDKALKTREKNLLKELEEKWKKKLEEEKLQAEGKWKELYELKAKEIEEEKKRLEQERIAVQIKDALTEKGLGNEFEKFIHVSSMEEVKPEVESLFLLVEAYTQKKIEALQNANIPVKKRGNLEDVYEKEVEGFIPNRENIKKPWE